MIRSRGPGFSSVLRKTNVTMRMIINAFVGVIVGFLIGFSVNKFDSNLFHSNSHNDDAVINSLSQKPWSSAECQNLTSTDLSPNYGATTKRSVPQNPRGTETLPPGIIASESDLYLRRLWGKPKEDLTFKQKYLVTFTVGYKQKDNINAAVKKFSDDFTIMLFHYDGLTTEWDEFEWSKRAIHVSAPKQTKWWYAKRFLHPDIVAPYEYIFIWDEDLGLEHFSADEYIKLVRKHGLEISQPGLEKTKKFTWPMTRRIVGGEVHKVVEEKPGDCNDHLPPCAAFVEIQAPVFSREAWRCVWHMIQNDLIHGWGIDFSLRRCVEPAHEKVGVVDAQWIIHQGIPTLWNQGKEKFGRKKMVRERCVREWGMFGNRMHDAETNYCEAISVNQRHSTDNSSLE
ncbi:hypothetical protein MKX01_038128 [Papaver californicum]|nr:hypothetical protein MKX01_038128 [Papaver californicum]